MTNKVVLMIGNPKLREKSSNIIDFGKELHLIVQDLKDTLKYLQGTKKIGRALAAPQIDHKRNVIYFGLPENPFVMVNPKIIEKSKEKFWIWDTCFSFDVAFFVEIMRHKRIKVEYYDEKEELTVKEFSDDLSELVQHEIDHLHGVLATDHITDFKRIMLRQEWEERVAK